MTLKEQMIKAKIDIPMTEKVLSEVNAGNTAGPPDGSGIEIPVIDGKRIIDRKNFESWGAPEKEILYRMEKLDIADRFRNTGTVSGSRRFFTGTELAEIGKALMPRVAFGVLNGGSASSYADVKKKPVFQSGTF